MSVRRVGTADPSQISAGVSLGRTPIAARPLVAGEYIVDLTGDGLLPVSFSARVAPGQALRVSRQLVAATTAHERMVPVPTGMANAAGGARSTPAFLIDAYEVSNEDFARFVTAGGYANQGLWPDTMIVDGRSLPRPDVLHRFVDRTNLPGPRTWSGGRFPEGKARHPVNGVSWYEASAYARWAGKELPTYAQWWRAAMDTASDGFPWGTDTKTAEKRANFSQSGTRDVGTLPSGVSPFGCYDMAGNVREWLRDAQPDGLRRNVTGGSWLDEMYMFEPSHIEQFEPAYANEAIGFRLVAPLPPRARRIPMRTLVLLPVILGWHLVLQTGAPALPSGDQWLTTPVDDRTFNTYLDFFNYDRKLPFDVKTAKVDEAQGLRRERLSFQSTSGVRVTAILFQAPATTGTRQPGMVLLHAGGPQGKDAAFMLRFGELISRAGWSVLSIDLQYFGERTTQLLSTFSEQEKHVKLYNQPAVYLAWVTQTVKDVSRAVDFLARSAGWTHGERGFLASVAVRCSRQSPAGPISGFRRSCFSTAAITTRSKPVICRLPVPRTTSRGSRRGRS